MRFFALLAIGVAGAACGSADDRPATWSYVSQAIIQPNCSTVGCHNHTATTEALGLSTESAGYTYLVGGVGAHDFVVPHQPDESPLMYYLKGDEFPRMPPSGPLPEPDIELIRQWILSGAPNN
jgi:hypothetical protein